MEPNRRLHKLRYSASASLVEQIRTRLDSGHYFLAVTEATNEEKAERIDRSAYLRYCHARFSELTGTVFMHGLSLSENDDHVLGLLESKDSQVSWVYVSLHNPAGAGAKRVIQRAQEMADKRAEAGGRRLTVKFYDADSAHVWR